MAEKQGVSPGDALPPAEPFACPEPGCTKTYRRREHLSRHRLNHRPKKIYTCEQCRKSFVRPDLLQRHQKRHEQGMILRNSGGYHGPRASVRSISLTEDIPDPMSALSSPGLWNVRPPSMAAVDPTGMPPPPPPVHAHVDAAHGPVQAAMAGMEGGLGLAAFPDLLPEPNQDFQHQLFFDPSANMVDTAADLDWLFGLAPLCSDDVDGELTLANTTAVPSESPTSTFSDQNNTEPTPGDTADPWVRARDSLIHALHGLPADVFETPFFAIGSLRAMWDAYFAGYHPHFPIVHKATTVVGAVQPLLLVAILSMGAVLSADIELYYAAERIHERLRWFIFSSGSFQPPAPLWLLQALLLVQAYEKMASSRKNHEMSHIFHGAVITLMRRGAAYNDTSSQEQQRGGGRASSVGRAWHRWAEQEASKRVAYFAFVMDAQHASVFGHAPALSVSDLRLPLPHAEAAWEAATPAAWKRALAAHPEPLAFLPSLRGLLAGRPVPSSASPFARFILLHGLFSVMKHMQLRDLTAMDVEDAEEVEDGEETSPGLGGNPAEANWKETMHRAIDTWSFSLLFQAPSVCLEAARPLHRIAHIVIHVPLVDFHTFVGAPPLVSNRVTKDEHDRARARLQAWAQTAAAKRALSHCVLLVQETMFTRRRYRAADDEIALRPWCLYHASLVLWTYGVMTEGLPPGGAGSSSSSLGAEEYLVHMLSGFMGEPSRIAHKNQTSGLLAAVREALDGCRWQLLQEAQTTLDKLINMVRE